MNNMKEYANVFDGIKPWSGQVPRGYIVDFLGTLTDARFRVMFGVDPATVGGGAVTTRLPIIADGEGWFEAVNWIAAAREARGSYTMVTLGACYGAQAVGSYMALQQVNPMPSKLVAVEPEPDNYEWTARHMRDNGIDPAQQWLLPYAISDRNEPVYFPVGSPGSGAQNCFATNEKDARENYVNELISRGDVEGSLRNLIMHNTTGMTKDLVPGADYDFKAEIKLMSAITLRDVLSPFDVVDYVESDIQQSEIIVFPPYVDLLRKKVRRIHIGTHGIDVHKALYDQFANSGWTIVFNFEPNSSFTTELGSFTTNDGVLTVRNPDL
jgi:hypothetical protein